MLAQRGKPLAIADVKQAIPVARFVEATPDLVNLTDVATVLGCSRQNVRTLILYAPAGDLIARSPVVGQDMVVLQSSNPWPQ